LRLWGKVAIVTGAGCGFGEGIAEGFAAEGASVLVNDLRGDQAERRHGGDRQSRRPGSAGRADVGERTGFQRLVGEAIAAFGRLDVVFNNAGVTHPNGPMLQVDEASFDRVFAVNVKAIYWSAMAAVPVFRNQGGGSFITTIASTAALRPRPASPGTTAARGRW
jgi:3-oxoacyl-[acyl-carrier protein] reductase